MDNSDAKKKMKTDSITCFYYVKQLFMLLEM